MLDLIKGVVSIYVCNELLWNISSDISYYYLAITRFIVIILLYKNILKCLIIVIS